MVLFPFTAILVLAAIVPMSQVDHLTDLLKTGGGYAVGAIFFFLYAWERIERQRLQKTVISLAVAAEKARASTAHAIEGFKELMQAMRNDV